MDNDKLRALVEKWREVPGKVAIPHITEDYFRGFYIGRKRCADELEALLHPPASETGKPAQGGE